MEEEEVVISVVSAIQGIVATMQPPTNYSLGDDVTDDIIKGASDDMRTSHKIYSRDGVRYPAINALDENKQFKVYYHADPKQWDTVNVKRQDQIPCPTKGVYAINVCDVVELDSIAWHLTRQKANDKYVPCVIEYMWYDITSVEFIIKTAFIYRLSPSTVLWVGIDSRGHKDDPLIGLNILSLFLSTCVFISIFVYPAYIQKGVPMSLQYLFYPSGIYYIVISSINIFNLKTDFRTIVELEKSDIDSINLISFMFFACSALISQQTAACKCPELNESARTGVLYGVLYALITVSFTMPIVDEQITDLLRFKFTLTRVCFTAMCTCLMMSATTSLYVIVVDRLTNTLSSAVQNAEKGKLQNKVPDKVQTRTLRRRP